MKVRIPNAAEWMLGASLLGILVIGGFMVVRAFEPLPVRFESLNIVNSPKPGETLTVEATVTRVEKKTARTESRLILGIQTGSNLACLFRRVRFQARSRDTLSPSPPRYSPVLMIFGSGKQSIAAAIHGSAKRRGWLLR